MASCHSVPASSVVRTALCPGPFLPSPWKRGGQWLGVLLGPGSQPQWTLVRPWPASQPDEALTVRASITSWKFLFPVILFFIARKASLGLDRGKEEGLA